MSRFDAIGERDRWDHDIPVVVVVEMHDDLEVDETIDDLEDFSRWVPPEVTRCIRVAYGMDGKAWPCRRMVTDDHTLCWKHRRRGQ